MQVQLSTENGRSSGPNQYRQTTLRGIQAEIPLLHFYSPKSGQREMGTRKIGHHRESQVNQRDLLMPKKRFSPCSYRLESEQVGTTGKKIIRRNYFLLLKEGAGVVSQVKVGHHQPTTTTTATTNCRDPRGFFSCV